VNAACLRNGEVHVLLASYVAGGWRCAWQRLSPWRSLPATADAGDAMGCRLLDFGLTNARQRQVRAARGDGLLSAELGRGAGSGWMDSTAGVVGPGLAQFGEEPAGLLDHSQPLPGLAEWIWRRSPVSAHRTPDQRVPPGGSSSAAICAWRRLTVRCREKAVPGGPTAPWFHGDHPPGSGQPARNDPTANTSRARHPSQAGEAPVAGAIGPAARRRLSKGRSGPWW